MPPGIEIAIKTCKRHARNGQIVIIFKYVWMDGSEHVHTRDLRLTCRYEITIYLFIFSWVVVYILGNYLSIR